MRLSRAVWLALVLALPSAAITITPYSYGGPFCHAASVATPAPCALSDQYAAGGLLFDFWPGTATAKNPARWVGLQVPDYIWANSVAVTGRIVVPGTKIPGVTNYLAVEIERQRESGDLFLATMDRNYVPTYRDCCPDGYTVNGRSQLVIQGPEITSFMLAHTPGALWADPYIYSITLGDIRPASPVTVPEPAGLLLTALGLLLLPFCNQLR